MAYKSRCKYLSWMSVPTVAVLKWEKWNSSSNTFSFGIEAPIHLCAFIMRIISLYPSPSWNYCFKFFNMRNAFWLLWVETYIYQCQQQQQKQQTQWLILFEAPTYVCCWFVVPREIFKLPRLVPRVKLVSDALNNSKISLLLCKNNTI